MSRCASPRQDIVRREGVRPWIVTFLPYRVLGFGVPDELNALPPSPRLCWTGPPSLCFHLHNVSTRQGWMPCSARQQRSTPHLLSNDSFMPIHSAFTGFRLCQTPFAISQTAQVPVRGGEDIRRPSLHPPSCDSRLHSRRRYASAFIRLRELRRDGSDFGETSWRGKSTRQADGEAT
jgi:hypothetical protein